MTDRSMKLTAAMDKLAEAEAILRTGNATDKALADKVWKLWQDAEGNRYGELNRKTVWGIHYGAPSPEDLQG